MLERNSHVALYLQLAELIENGIQEGHYRPFDRLPTEQQLIEAYGVSRITVRQALDHLLGRGLIVRKQGKGTFVAGPVIERDLLSLRELMDQLAEQSDRPEIDLLLWEEAVPPAHVRRALNAGDPPLYHLVRLFRRNGQPFAISDSYFSEFVGDLTRQHATTRATCDIIETIAGQAIAHSIVRTRIQPGDNAMAEQLGITAGTPLLVLERTSFSEANEPMDFSTFYSDATRFDFTVAVDGRFPVPPRIQPQKDE